MYVTIPYLFRAESFESLGVEKVNIQFYFISTGYLEHAEKTLEMLTFSKQNSLKRFTFCAGNIRWFTTMIMWYDPRCPDFKILGEWWKMNPFAWYFLMARRDYLLLFFVGDFLMDSTMVSRHENNPTWGICLDLFPITQQANPQGMVVHPDDSLVFSFSKKKSAAEVELVSALRCPSKCGKKQGQVKANQGGGNVFFFRRWRRWFFLEEFSCGNEVWIFFFFIQPEILGADHRKTIQRNDIWILLKWW